MRYLTLLALLACGSSGGPVTPPPPPPPPPSGQLQILMLGNSLTYSNDLPGMIAELADRGGAERPSVTVIAFANFSLEDHWNYGTSTAAMDAGTYDVVILQQGPSTQPASGINLADYSGRIVDRMIKFGTRAGLYVVWPPVGGDINAGIANYTAAADAKSAALYPVAHAFRALAQSHPDIALYGPDAFHPSYAGSWLAAMTIVATIFDQDPLTHPNLFPRFIPAEWELPLQLAAKAAVEGYGRP